MKASKVFGRPKGVHSEAGQRRRACRGDLSQGRDRCHPVTVHFAAGWPGNGLLRSIEQRVFNRLALAVLFSRSLKASVASAFSVVSCSTARTFRAFEPSAFIRTCTDLNAPRSRALVRWSLACGP
jgi:hypothetical protein